MTRAEHLAWAKQRALQLLDAGDADGAFNSMLSDLRKHPELEDHVGAQLGLMLRLAGFWNEAECRKWITGFN